MGDEARQAKLLAVFGSLSGNNQELVLKVSEMIQAAKQENAADPLQTGDMPDLSNKKLV
jgi:hypothetical protein